ncbi:MAG: hypothetical protein ACKVOM_04755, partial [Ferruginibacter sp.]
MKQFLLSKLADPYSGEELIFSPKDNSLTTHNGNMYLIRNDIAIMIDAAQQKNGHERDLHKNLNSNFDYLQHYETDAALFDYFNAHEPSTTKNERNRGRQAIINAVPKNAVTILDIGCCGAWLAAYFLPMGKQIVSSDISGTNPTKALAVLSHKNNAGIVCDA